MSSLSGETNSGARREVLGLMQAQRIGEASDARAVAEAAAGTWDQVAAALVPVIGVRGVYALFNRALNLISATSPWLVIDGGQGDDGARVAEFKACLESQEAAVAAEAARAVLAKFIELLSGLIGAALTERLLMPIWAAEAPVAKVEDEAS